MGKGSGWISREIVISALYAAARKAWISALTVLAATAVFTAMPILMAGFSHRRMWSPMYWDRRLRDGKQSKNGIESGLACDKGLFRNFTFLRGFAMMKKRLFVKCCGQG